MKWLKELHLTNFRNFENLSVTFEPHVNVIVGENGIGKTNLLEAIHLLSIGRSFRTSEMKELIRQGAGSFFVEAVFEDAGIEQSLRLSYDGRSKILKHNETSYKSFSSLLGLLPSVIYSPTDIALIIGSPKERRRFINIELSQSDPLYVYYLTRYAKAMAQRNVLLKQKSAKAIEVFEQEMIKSGSYIVHKRKSFLEELSQRANDEYNELSEHDETIHIKYLPSLDENSFTLERFAKERKKEMMAAHTLIGPHRDDFDITLNRVSAKKFASEGQKRSILSAIKLASLSRFEDPIFSIDDFGSHLDQTRKALLKEQVKSKDQIFLTMPEPIQIDDSLINSISLERLKSSPKERLTTS